MITKAQIKHITSLHQGKFRDEFHEFIAEGVKVVDELLHSDYVPKTICANSEWIEANKPLLDKLSAELIEVNASTLERITAMSTPNRVLVVFQQKQSRQIPAIAPDELVLVLDELKDPGNLGTIIRIADWFGIDKIICSRETVDVYNPKTVQSTMGSLARVDTFYTDLLSFLDSVPEGCNIFATTMEGENIITAQLPKGGLILIGSESHGLSEVLLQKATRFVTIPRYLHTAPVPGHAESLNASVATAIVCSEFRRRL